MQNDIYSDFNKNLYRSDYSVPELDALGQSVNNLSIQQVASSVGSNPSQAITPEELDMSLNAEIKSDGSVVLKDVKIGGTTTQYQATNSGIFSFGDGSDGAGVADGSTALAGASLAANVYTLTRDVYYTDLTVSTGVTIKPSGYRIFSNGTLTLNGTGSIARNGNNGSAGVDATAGAGGAALADGYLKGSVAGGNGGNGNNIGGGGTPAVAGSNGTNTSNSIGNNGSDGGNGGAGDTAAASGGTGGVATVANVKLIANWHLATLLDISSTGSTIKYDNSAGAGGGGGGARPLSANAAGGGGGGGASGGGIVAVYARSIVIEANASITANGGDGGNGGNGSTSTNSGGGGGGAGGNGGQVLLCYNTLLNNGTISAVGGAGGTGGSGSGTGSSGGAGTAGTAGDIRQFQLSL